MKTNHIYLLQNPSDPDWFKCGETTNPISRLRTFQTGYPQQIEWYGCWIAPKGLSDKHLHPLIAKIANDKRSEWFKGDIREAAEIIKAKIASKQEAIREKACKLDQNIAALEEGNRSHHSRNCSLDAIPEDFTDANVGKGFYPGLPKVQHKPVISKALAATFEPSPHIAEGKRLLATLDVIEPVAFEPLPPQPPQPQPSPGNALETFATLLSVAFWPAIYAGWYISTGGI